MTERFTYRIEFHEGDAAEPFHAVETRIFNRRVRRREEAMLHLERVVKTAGHVNISDLAAGSRVGSLWGDGAGDTPARMLKDIGAEVAAHEFHKVRRDDGVFYYAAQWMTGFHFRVREGKFTDPVYGFGIDRQAMECFAREYSDVSLSSAGRLLFHGRHFIDWPPERIRDAVLAAATRPETEVGGERVLRRLQLRQGRRAPFEFAVTARDGEAGTFLVEVRPDGQLGNGANRGIANYIRWNSRTAVKFVDAESGRTAAQFEPALFADSSIVHEILNACRRRAQYGTFDRPVDVPVRAGR